MIKYIKKRKYYYFFKNNKVIKTTLNNKVKVDNKATAVALCKYLSLCFSKKNKEKDFFLKVLFFSFDLNKNSSADIINKIVSFLDTDLVCYRAEKKSELESIQKKYWDPLIFFVEKKYNFIFNTTNGVMPIQQEPSNKNKLLKILKKLSKYELISFFYISNFSNSNIITLNFLANNINFRNAWKYLSLEEVYSLKKWGQDKEAKEKLLEKKSYLNEVINFNLIFKNQEK